MCVKQAMISVLILRDQRPSTLLVHLQKGASNNWCLRTIPLGISIFNEPCRGCSQQHERNLEHASNNSLATSPPTNPVWTEC